MSDSKQLLDVLVQAQNKSVENLMEASQKMREVIGKPDALEQAKSLYGNWFEKQESITSDMAKMLKDQVINDKTPAFIKDWVDTQEQFSEKWLNAFKDLAGNFSGEKCSISTKKMSMRCFRYGKRPMTALRGCLLLPLACRTMTPLPRPKKCTIILWKVPVNISK
ncbi:MAG: hypothetical protein HC913_19000 [Microscillaceae bacterium]|nr:hypothetical protein [Microscillaceae bacterium]